MSFPTYRYIVADLLSDTNIGSLPLTNVSFSRTISRAGSFSGSWTIGTKQQAKLAEYVADRVGRCVVWCYRDSELWWGGPLWTMNPTVAARGTGSLSLQAATFESYFARRFIRAPLSYTNQDQTWIMAALLEHMQGTPNGNIGLEYNVEPSGVLRTIEYPGDGAATYGQRVQEMGDLEDGVEHTVDIFAVPGGREKRWRTGTPTLAADIPARIVMPGTRIPSYARTIDATKGGTSFQTRGKDGLLSAVAWSDDLIAAGWPQLDYFTDRSSVTDIDTLNEFTRADRDRFSGQLTAPTYEAYFGGTGWHPNRIGEKIRIKHSADDWLRPGASDEVRPVSVSVSVPDRGGSRETMKFVIEASADGAEV